MPLLSSSYKNDVRNEKWIRCIKCVHWIHKLCAELEKGKWRTFICELCMGFD